MILALLAWTDIKSPIGWLSPCVVTVGYSLTFFFHMVPAATETLTRLPSTAPVFASSDDPAFQTIYGIFFLLFLAGASLQVRRLLKQENRGVARLSARR